MTFPGVWRPFQRPRSAQDRPPREPPRAFLGGSRVPKKSPRAPKGAKKGALEAPERPPGEQKETKIRRPFGRAC